MSSKYFRIQGTIVIIVGIVLGIILGNYYKIDIDDSYYRETYVFNFWMFLLISGITDVLGSLLIGVATIIDKLDNNVPLKSNTVGSNPVNGGTSSVRICRNCGATISPSATVCTTCGANLKVRAAAPSQNAWICPKCGRENQNYVGTCGCGEIKPK
ncbi:MAG: zinc ribbon domain-containing protein [Ruminococcaceae bacterium]|nr:zinc ribbon domain-containing protein [Oscillospiraceae bacterium]